MNKKGQISAFIVIGILIVAGIAVGVYFFSIKNLDLITTGSSSDFNVYAEQCLLDIAKKDLVKLGLQGGYFETPENGLEFYEIKVPYYFNKDRSLILSEEQIKGNLAAGIEKEFPESCIEKYKKQFKNDLSFESSKDKETTIEFGDKLVQISVNVPVTVSLENNSNIIEDYQVKVPVRFKTLYDTASKIVQIQETDKYHICMSCIDAIRDQNISISGFIQNNNDIVFILTDLNSTIEDKEYRYLFAAKYIEYDCNSLPADIDEFVKESCELENEIEE